MNIERGLSCNFVYYMSILINGRDLLKPIRQSRSVLHRHCQNIAQICKCQPITVKTLPRYANVSLSYETPEMVCLYVDLIKEMTVW